MLYTERQYDMVRNINYHKGQKLLEASSAQTKQNKKKNIKQDKLPMYEWN